MSRVSQIPKSLVIRPELAAVFAETVERFVVRDGVDLTTVADLDSVRVALVMAAHRLNRVVELRETARSASTTHVKYLLLTTPAMVDRRWPAARDADAALDAAEAAFETDKTVALALLAGLSAGATYGDVLDALHPAIDGGAR
ncbi:hypothetical protein N4G70_29280 [Streptomyces sp. ASQP_92]|uniref:hypothetical protein n=1 Tax=Streptomyces sp. ASQP_92 TaxID=2979116 RepID=UPI0021BEBDAC|nr:hypothetical protein [Streptomyces sp. ASQP_92]MCT9092934.1 hypothetical protein [Streptomyces sp. ASQP_92]